MIHCIMHKAIYIAYFDPFLLHYNVSECCAAYYQNVMRTSHICDICDIYADLPIPTSEQSLYPFSSSHVSYNTLLWSYSPMWNVIWSYSMQEPVNCEWVKICDRFSHERDVTPPARNRELPTPTGSGRSHSKQWDTPSGALARRYWNDAASAALEQVEFGWRACHV